VLVVGKSKRFVKPPIAIVARFSWNAGARRRVGFAIGGRMPALQGKGGDTARRALKATSLATAETGALGRPGAPACWISTSREGVGGGSGGAGRLTSCFGTFAAGGLADALSHPSSSLINGPLLAAGPPGLAGGEAKRGGGGVVHEIGLDGQGVTKSAPQRCRSTGQPAATPTAPPNPMDVEINRAGGLPGRHPTHRSR